MLRYYAEQSSMFANNNPQNAQAQIQAQYWAERWTHVQQLIVMGQAQNMMPTQAAQAMPPPAPPGVPSQPMHSFQPPPTHH